MIYDINLIPKSKVKTTGNTNTLLLLSALAAVVLLGILGFYFPFQQKLALENQITEQKSTLLSYSDTEETFTSLQNSLDEINTTNQMMDTIESNNLKITDMLNDIETNMPKNIVIKAMTLDAGMLTIEGISPTYTEVADFIVNLRNIENVGSVSFMSAQQDTSIGQGTSQLDSSTKQLFNFTLYVKYNTEDALAQLIATQAKDVNAAEQEVAPNETN